MWEMQCRYCVVLSLVSISSRRIPVFHITSGQKNPLTWREVLLEKKNSYAKTLKNNFSHKKWVFFFNLTHQLTAHVESWLPVFPMARMGRFPGVTINHSEWKDWIYRLTT